MYVFSELLIIGGVVTAIEMAVYSANGWGLPSMGLFINDLFLAAGFFISCMMVCRYRIAD